MHPTIKSGDIAIYKPIRNIGSKLLINKGSIVIALDPRDKKSMIIKRVYKISNSGISLRGDNELYSTDSRQFGVIDIRNIKGIVEGIITNKFD
tara:strand:+ start:159 stop:437 length:279 start_codon:yes stop_codon:yes gene_type:complete